jgi:hypothetical protein
LIAFFAIVPFHREWLENNKSTKLYAWSEKLMESEEIANILGEMNVEEIMKQ